MQLKIAPQTQKLPFKFKEDFWVSFPMVLVIGEFIIFPLLVQERILMCEKKSAPSLIALRKF